MTIALISLGVMLSAAAKSLDQTLIEVTEARPPAASPAERDEAARQRLEARGDTALPMFAEARLDEDERRLAFRNLEIEKLVDAEVMSVQYELDTPRAELTRVQKRAVERLVTLLTSDAPSASRKRARRMLTELAKAAAPIDGPHPHLGFGIDASALQAEVLGRLARRIMAAADRNDAKALHANVLAAWRVLIRAQLMIAAAPAPELDVENAQFAAFARVNILSTFGLLVAAVPLQNLAYSVGGMVMGVGCALAGSRMCKLVPRAAVEGHVQRRQVDREIDTFWKNVEPYLKYRSRWNQIIHSDDRPMVSSRPGSPIVMKNFVRLLTAMKPGSGMISCEVPLQKRSGT